MVQNKPPVLLFAFANYHEGPSGYLRNLPVENSEIREALKQAASENLCELVFLPNVTIQEVINVFQDKNYKDRIAVFHFAGHADDFTLSLEDPFRQKSLLYADGFMAFLAAQPELKLVFLNACVTQQQAKMLHQKGIPVVISTNNYVADNLAKDIAINFYRALGNGDTIGEAFLTTIQLAKAVYNVGNKRQLYVRDKVKEVKEEIPWQIFPKADEKGKKNWNLPEASLNPLYTLPALAEPLPLPVEPFPGLRPYNREEAKIFWGRDFEIKRLYDFLRLEVMGFRLSIFTGARGVGKTSLLLAGLIPRLETIRQVLYIDLASSKTPLRQIIEFAEEAKKDGVNYIFLDHTVTIDSTEYLSSIIQRCKMFNNIHLVFCTHSTEFERLRKLTTQIHSQSSSFYLGPISVQGIQHVLGQFEVNEDVIKTYGVKMDDQFATVISNYIVRDAIGTKTTLFQVIMFELWGHAKRASLRIPHLSTDLFYNSINENFWEHFIEERLLAADAEKYRSGLALNILHDIAQTKITSKDSLLAKYQHLNGFDEYIDKLFSASLISEPATDRADDFNKLQLIHSSFIIPILNLNHRSTMTGQKARRIIEYNTEENSIGASTLDEMEWMTVQNGRLAMPSLSETERQLFNRSKDIIDAKKRKRTIVLIIKVLLVVLLIGFGTIFQEPYLLLFILLVVILYDG